MPIYGALRIFGIRYSEFDFSRIAQSSIVFEISDVKKFIFRADVKMVSIATVRAEINIDQIKLKSLQNLIAPLIEQVIYVNDIYKCKVADVLSDVRVATQSRCWKV